jgi:hypothetical protein
MLYEDRAVAFVDVLGFKALIESTIDNNGNEIEQKSIILNAFFEEIEREFCSEERWPEDDNVFTRIVTHFSDSIVFSVKGSEKDAVIRLLDYIHYLLITGIKYEILFRGGITYGKVVHNEKRIFGPAMNSAYYLENIKAITPRIIIDNEVIRQTFINRGPQADIDDVKKYLTTFINEDNDGYYYIDYFNNILNELEWPCDMQAYSEDLKNIIIKNENIIKNIRDRKSKNNLKQKNIWLKKKFNAMIKEQRSNIPNYPEYIDDEGWYDLGNYWKSCKLFHI